MNQIKIRSPTCSSNQLTKLLSPKLLMKNHHDFLISVFGTNLSKTDIWKCPLKKFEGNIHIITSEDDQKRKRTRKAIERVLSAHVVGFDTETAVTFPRRNSYPHQIGLVQIAIDSDVILWRLRRKKQYAWKEFPVVLKNILKNNNVKKVGNGTYDDLKDLYESYNVTVSNMVDNQVIATDIGYNKIGLVPLAAQLFGWRISKAEQLSNWEIPELSEAQIQYASTDAWVSLMIYHELARMSEILQKGGPSKGVSSFEHILRQEAKMDANFLHSLDFFNGKMHTKSHHQNESINKRQKARLSFNANDYDVTEIIPAVCKIDTNPQEQSLYMKDTVPQFPFIYQVT